MSDACVCGRSRCVGAGNSLQIGDWSGRRHTTAAGRCVRACALMRGGMINYGRDGWRVAGRGYSSASLPHTCRAMNCVHRRRHRTALRCVMCVARQDLDLVVVADAESDGRSDGVAGRGQLAGCPGLDVKLVWLWVAAHGRALVAATGRCRQRVGAAPRHRTVSATCPSRAA